MPEIHTMPKAVIFDLDGTLARSKQAIGAPMADLLCELLARTNVAIISGGAFAQFKKQVIDQLPKQSDLSHLYIFPTSGGALYAYTDGVWTLRYEERLTDEEANHIEAILRSAAESIGVIDFSSPSYGDRIEKRGSEVTLSALGQEAPVEEKESWDPDRSKRIALRTAVAELLPQYDVKTGGATSIDVTKQGVNKAFGLRKLAETLHIGIDDMLYLGDALYEGGNDAIVKETGVRTRAVADPRETMEAIEELLGSEGAH